MTGGESKKFSGADGNALFTNVEERAVIAAVGPSEELLTRYPNEPRLDARNGVVMPGLVDPHTHLVWAGDRAADLFGPAGLNRGQNHQPDQHDDERSYRDDRSPASVAAAPTLKPRR